MLEKDFTSLEVSNRLKELGITQYNCVNWVDDPFTGKKRVSLLLKADDSSTAFTTGMLGQVLRELSIKFPGWNFEGGFQWRTGGDLSDKLHLSGSEADARAELLIWHVMNGLVSVGQINEILKRVMQ